MLCVEANQIGSDLEPIATTLDPEILLLDEILSVGDHAFRKKSGARIRSMMENSKLILIVSHNSSLIRELCTHCLWLESGRVRAFGDAAEVMGAYEAEIGESA